MLDNGGYRQFSRAGLPWHDPLSVQYDWSKFDRQLAKYRAGCYEGGELLFAVAPDVVGGGLASLRFSLEALHEREEDAAGVQVYRRTRRVPWALVVSEGITQEDIFGADAKCHVCGHSIWQHFDYIFLGGSHEFKESTVYAWREVTRKFGLKLHYGRCSNAKRITLAKLAGCDSADSAAVLWNEQKWAAAEAAVAA